MTELDIDPEGILDGFGAEIPASVRKVLRTAVDNGWQLNKPGMTIALRFDHPSLENAWPVYITWAIGRTAKGKVSWRFNSCGTRSLVSLSGAELLEYLEDPELVMPQRIPGKCESHLCDADEVFVWVTGEEYCLKHAKTGLTKKDYDLGHRGPASDYDPEAPVEWDKDSTAEANVTKALGGEIVMGHDTVAGPPLRVQAPALRVTPPSPR